ncbi:MAG: sugar ABC transporter permease [Clostridia bacterium]|nr:sugar ABC transporter permease [Clostridia bacterium]MBQ7051502.1 sugar ABC transporter permease [Clostridia bacterium]
MTQKTPKKRHAKGVDTSRYGYYFIAPFFIVYLVFQAYPLLNTVYLAFQRYMITGTNKVVGPTFYGLKNFQNVLTKGSTIAAFQNTIIMWVINFIPQILLALLLAKWFTDTRLKIRGQGAIKVMVYMPNIITAASISVLFYSLFAYPQGPVNSLLAQVGVIDKATYLNTGTAATVAIPFLEKGWHTRLIIAFINFWMWYGNTMIVLVAGMLGISPNLFEAAEVDGATPNQIFTKITMPLLKPIMLYTLVTSLIGGMQMYDIPQMMQQQGSPAKDMTMTVTMYIMELVYTGTKDYGRGAAVSVLLFLFTGVLSIILFFIMSDRDEARARKAQRKARKGAKA